MHETEYAFECRRCGADITCLVDLHEHLVDVPEQCEACGATVSEAQRSRAYDEGLEDALGRWTDRAQDLFTD